MSANRDQERGTWTVRCRYTDWQGNRKEKHKRGFQTKREALEWERQFLLQNSKDIAMGFEAFVGIYLKNIKPRIKPTTYQTKQYIIRDKILPYFSNKRLCDIESSDIIQWQNELINMRDESGRTYQPTYLRTVSNQMSAIFNHAVRYYNLPQNPCMAAGKMGRHKASEMLFWTKEEYDRFILTMIEKPISYYAFQLLYFTGIRIGELMALTRADFDFTKRTMRINKNYQVIQGKMIIQKPKSEKSIRIIDLPQFLSNEIEDYCSMIYGLKEEDRLFELSKSFLHHEMDRGVKASGVKRIRLHDLRHSHVAYLIELGFSPVEIAERLGHESISVTYQYAHLYPSKQRTMAERMNEDHIKEQADGR